MSRSSHRRAQLGLSLVELMVGITVGLIVTAAASMVAINQITEHRRLMLETQIQQDLRSAVDLVQLDLRRAGFRGFTGNGVWTPASGAGSSLEVPAMAASANAYADVEISADNHSLVYSYSRKDEGKPSDAPADNEYAGIQWRPGNETLYLLVGRDGDKFNWQPVTDPDVVKITDFKVVEEKQTVDLIDFCDCVGPICEKAGPKQDVRRLKITLQGQAKHDPQVVRTVTVTQKLRADQVTGSCPT